MMFKKGKSLLYQLKDGIEKHSWQKPNRTIELYLKFALYFTSLSLIMYKLPESSESLQTVLIKNLSIDWVYAGLCNTVSILVKQI